MTLRLRLPFRRGTVRRFLGSLRCVLRGHVVAGLCLENGEIYARCRVCGARTEGVRVFTPLRGGR